MSFITTLVDPFNITDLIRVSVQLLKQTTERSRVERENYAAKLEAASGNDIFKYVLLTNISALDGYIAQTRIQAAQSFRLCQIVAVLGFMLILFGIGLGVYFSMVMNGQVDIAYLSAGAGLLTEFISGIFFYMYNKSLKQINRFHDKLVVMQQASIAFLACSLIDDPSKQDDTKIELSKGLLNASCNNGS
ncbi:hypothetical protein DesfrDRAFT_3467 [Solidesulfovibrio fructosivorans JJ]]|uniref:Cyanobacterial TRADD-N associated 2 transmembrane domain-containing protein n=1 Tax=Solidesulfovibrio fructosivorans JJ] TaxID=596151 RepID=E1K0R7_SOLFR|nr:hypothetical protein [Solidesulfovibrio fructosivorans]EFL49831.1 hypothetical protein DesfrDRAFT_3467 [Solidesulfovibrio fructosivorans JJ]]